MLGQYGLQRWDARSGRYESPEPLPGVEVARRRLPELLADAPEGVVVEDKQQALVVHFRRAPDPDAALASLRSDLGGGPFSFVPVAGDAGEKALLDYQATRTDRLVELLRDLPDEEQEDLNRLVDKLHGLLERAPAN